MKKIPKVPRGPTREGKRHLGFYVVPEVWKQFRLLALDMGLSGQDLGEMVIKNLLQQRAGNPADAKEGDAAP